MNKIRKTLIIIITMMIDLI